MKRTLSQKITRQPMKCVSAPPNKGPMLKPSIKNPVQAPDAAARRSRGALVSTAAKVEGTANAAARTLQGTPGQQCSLCAGEGNDAGRDGEQRQSSYRCRSCAKPIRRLAAEYDAGSRDEKVGIDRPFNASGA